MDRSSRISKGLRHPWQAFRYGIGIGRGSWYRLKFRLLRRRVTIGKRFRVQGNGTLDIRGPGRVVFGDDCTVITTRVNPTTIYTHAPDALVRFGDFVGVGGTRFGCVLHIEVEDAVLLADAHIVDSDFHQLVVRDELRRRTRGESRPVLIRRNAWVAAGAMVLKGVTIGENAVVGARAVVAGDVAPHTLVIGNPARAVRELPS